jgi:hypothetical protein
MLLKFRGGHDVDGVSRPGERLGRMWAVTTVRSVAVARRDPLLNVFVQSPST